ncbi:MAG: RsmB/NOP family class I SAM-dependent RNA methyltransferase [Paracoccaceae bacterium]
MRPDARIQTAIELLDRILAGAPAEQALTAWARTSRFAGSGDRAAIRDHVFDGLRCLRSLSALAGAREPGGRAVMLGAILAAGRDPDLAFTGAPHSPAPLTDAERALATASDGVVTEELADLDCPDWLRPRFEHALGADAGPVLRLMRERAPVILRVNAARATRETAIRRLACDGIGTKPHPLSSFALEVSENAQKIKSGGAYLEGLIELQDASPQAAVEVLPIAPGQRVLDYCAGGGGKTLALAARSEASFFAHDAAPARMRDLPARAARAGARVSIVTGDELSGIAPFDLVIADVPCSGTGTWRRAPGAKWTLTAQGLADLTGLQARILDAAGALVGPGGRLAYMTCSLLAEENRDQIDAFLERSPGWTLEAERRFTPLENGDGFYSALLTRV